MNYPKLIKQKTPTTCGQCCIATLMDTDVEFAIELVGHDGIMDDDDMQDVFCWHKLFVCLFENGTPPKGSVAIQKHKDPNGDREHWTVWWRDKTLDPASIGSRLWPVYKYMIIDWI